MKSKLLIIITSLNFGGAERVVSELLNNIDDDFELHLILFYNIIKYPVSDKVQVYHLNESVNSGSFSMLARLPLIARKVAKYCQTKQIETSVSFLNRPCYINAMMKTLWGYKGKLIMCERSHQSSILEYLGGGSKIYKIITKNLIKYSYKNADLLLANSQISKIDLQQKFGVKQPIKVIYNPIDIDKIDKSSAEKLDVLFKSETFYFISTGIFRVEKNFSLLLKAFCNLKQLPVKLILIGDGVLKENLQMLAKELRITDKVIFTGFQQNPFKYISRSHCFVLSSFTEGFPNVLLEALACGKAIISTDCLSGPRELLAPKTDIHTKIKHDYEIAEYGVLTPVDDEKILAKAMTKIYEDDALRLSYENKAKLHAATFNVQIIKEEFVNAFLSV